MANLEIEIVEISAPRTLRFRRESIDLERMPPGSVAARTLYTAISPGTELAAYRGDPPLRPGAVYPRLLGYCNVGEVVAVSGDAHGMNPGDRVLTFQSHRTGFVCPAREVIAVLPPHVDAKHAAVTYLFHLAYNAILKGGLRPGHRVGVLGLGTLGLATVALAARSGAIVYGFSNQGHLRSLALEFGAEGAWGKSREGVAEVHRGSGGIGVDLLVTTSNRWSDWDLALRLPRKEGTIVVLGFPGRSEGPPTFNPLATEFFYDQQLKIIAAGYSPDLDVAPHDVRFTIKRNCAFLLEMIAAGRLPAAALIGFEAPFREIVSIYEALDSRAGAALTGVLGWT